MKAFRSSLFSYRFTLTGLNLERFLNTLQKEGVPLLSLRRKDVRALECECYAPDLEHIRAIALDKGWRMGQESPLRLSGLFHWLRLRPGIWIGGALALCLMMVALQFIWSIQIVGAGAYRADIAAFLREEGLTPGLPRSHLNAAELEKKLTHRYPQVAWFHVYAYNVTMVVDCVLGSPAPALPSLESGDLLAARDGVVASIQVFAGTAAVQAGDPVQKGQVLIWGWERGREDQRVPVAARGVINARCWESAKVRLPLYEVLSAETGNRAVQTQLCTPWFSYPAKVESPDFLAYNTYVSTLPIVGAFFPCYYQTVEQREVWMEYALRDLAEVTAEARTAAENELKKNLRGYEIVDKWVDYCMIEGDTLALALTGEWQMDIGETAT